MDDFSLDAMTNPALIEKRILDAYEEYVTNGTGVVVDSNNTFMFILEMFAQLTSDSVQAIMNKLDSLYPQRAQKAADLYMHMSDYDYVNMFSSPASTVMEIVLGKDELIANAAPIYAADGSELPYRKISIPEDSIFTIGSHKFSLYYPIDIRINTLTKAFSVVYNTDSDVTCLNGVNPFIKLSSNTVEYMFQSYKDIEIVSLRFPVYQYEKNTVTSDISSTTGFKKDYSYSNNFYAIRLFRSVNGSWVEMNQTLSDIIYDPLAPTAKIVVDTESKKVTVSIPQIYFSSNIIGSQIKAVIYSTEGELDVDISNISLTQVKCVFQGTNDTTSSVYSTPLNRAQTLQVYPAATSISGGSNGYDFETLRSRIINNNFYDSVLARFSSVQAKMEDLGYEASRYLDGIRDRILFCSRRIVDSNGDVIASGQIPIHISSEIVSQMTDGSIVPSDYKWVRYRAADKSLMILPTALMLYDPTSNTSTLVKDGDYPSMETDVAKRADMYNKNQYTYTPFHIRLSLDTTAPVAYSYNLLNPTVDRIFFMGNNASFGESINGYTATMIHNNYGTGGYTLRVAVSISDNLRTAIENASTETSASGANVYVQDIWPSDIIVYLKLKESSTSSAKCFAILKPTLEKDGNNYLYELNISTNYFINNNNELDVDLVNQSLDSTPSYGKLTSTNRVPLTSEDWSIVFLINKNKAKYIDTDNEITDSELATYMAGAGAAGIGASAISDLGSDYIPVAEQQLTLTFGKYMSRLFNNVQAFAGSETYATYTDDQYLTTSTDTYLRTNWSDANLISTGNVKYTVDASGVVFPLEKASGNCFVDTEDSTILDISSIAVEQRQVLYADTTAANGYVNYNGYAYSLNSEWTTISADMFTNDRTLLIYDAGSVVYLTADNSSTYIGSVFRTLSAVTEECIVLKTSASSVGTVSKGMVVLEIPTATDGVYSPIRDLFSNGIAIKSISGSSLLGYSLVLDTSIISNGVRVTCQPKQVIKAFANDSSTASMTTAQINTISGNGATAYQGFRVVIGKPILSNNAGDVILDSTGSPTVVGTRSLEYYVEVIQLDARAFIDISTSEKELRLYIANLIDTYVKTVDTYAPELLEETKFFYKPKRSIGNTLFKVGKSTTKTLPLQVATEFVLTVTEQAYNSEEIRAVITKKVASYLEAMLKDSLISVTAISEYITDNLSDYVRAVSVCGFNTESDLSDEQSSSAKLTSYATQVLSLVDEEATLSVRRYVYVNDRNVLSSSKALTVSFTM